MHEGVGFVGLGRASSYTGLGRPLLVYTQQWIDGLKNVSFIGATATVEFWNRSDETRVYNPATNKYTVTYTPIATDIPARVQPIRSAVQRFTAVDGTWAGHMLVSMNYDDRFRATAGMRMKVLTTTHNDDLQTFFYTIKEILDSDNSIEFTLLAEIDTELRSS